MRALGLPLTGLLAAAAVGCAGCGSSSGADSTPRRTGPDLRQPIQLAVVLKGSLGRGIRAHPGDYAVPAGTSVKRARCARRGTSLRYACVFSLSNGQRFTYIYRVTPDGAIYNLIKTFPREE